MSKKFYKLDDIADFSNINNFFKGVGTPTFTANAQQIDLWSEAEFEDIFEQQNEKSFYNKETLDPWGAFKNRYTQWLARNGGFIANELSALLSKYNPIYNYDRHEVTSGSDTMTKTPTDWVSTKTETPDNWKETETQTPTNWKETRTETPTNWKETKTDTPTNWKETETQTPTNWQVENIKSYTNYHETETQTPTNWEKTKTDTPTNWTKTDTDSFTDYKETEEQKPNTWVKSFETQQTSGNITNGETTVNKIIPYGGSEFVDVSGADSNKYEKRSETQSGIYKTEKGITGTKAVTETQTGTYQTVEAQDGTYETDKAITGTATDTKTQSGTYQTETSHTGTYQTETERTGTYQSETAQSGTFKTERETTGSRTETTEQTGTYEEETAYGKEVTITGNIGVLSTEDMIQQVIALYDTDFVKRWITRFIDSVCVYV